MNDYQVQIGGSGVAAGDIESGLDVELRQPFVGNDGEVYYQRYVGPKMRTAEDHVNPVNYRIYRAPHSPVQNDDPLLQLNATTLRKDEWIAIDEATMAIKRQRLGGFQAIIDAGLTYNIGNAMGTTVFQYDAISDAHEAEMTMDGITIGQGDRPLYSTGYIPLPLVHVDWELNLRVLSASRNRGAALDTTNATYAVRKVAEYLENQLYTNVTYSYGGGTIYSFINYPNKNNVTLTLNWDAALKTGVLILADVQDMITANKNAFFNGPYTLMIPTAYAVVMGNDYTTGYPKTIRQRLMELEEISNIITVNALPANNVLLVEMSTEVVRILMGLGIQNIQWQELGGFVTKYKTITIQVPQIRSDYDGNCGYCHLAA